MENCDNCNLNDAGMFLNNYILHLIVDMVPDGKTVSHFYCLKKNIAENVYFQTLL